jgi:hypothetical protein
MAELKPYNPTIRDRIASALMGEARPGSARANMVEGLMGSRGIGTMGVGLADLTPIGAGLGAQEAAREGDYRGAAMNAMFLGPMARTANRTALTQAEKMAAGGASRDEIWNKTGWFQGPDSKWRFEIPDNNIRLDTAGRAGLGADYGEAYHMGSVLKHHALYEAYPELRDVTTRLRMGKGAAEGEYAEGAGYRFVNASAPTQEDMRQTLLHELQHGVQGIEGFSTGGTTRGPRALTPEGYWRSAGEVEARNTELRRNWTAAERANAPPWVTQDVPFSEQILRAFGGK